MKCQWKLKDSANDFSWQRKTSQALFKIVPSFFKSISISLLNITRLTNIVFEYKTCIYSFNLTVQLLISNLKSGKHPNVYLVLFLYTFKYCQDVLCIKKM